MGYRRHGWLLAALVLFFAPTSALAGQDAPVYMSTGTDPTIGGACVGDRVWIEHDDGTMWCCTSGTWEACGQVDRAASAFFADHAVEAEYFDHNPANCASGSVAGGIAADGAAEACLDPLTQTEGDARYIQSSGFTDVNYPAGGTGGDLQVKAPTGSGFAAYSGDACGVGAYATGITADGNLACSTPSYTTDTSYPSATDGAIQIAGTNGTFSDYAGDACGSGQYATGLDLDGNLTCSTPPDDDTLAGISANNGQILRYTGGAWVAGPDMAYASVQASLPATPCTEGHIITVGGSTGVPGRLFACLEDSTGATEWTVLAQTSK